MPQTSRSQTHQYLHASDHPGTTVEDVAVRDAARVLREVAAAEAAGDPAAALRITDSSPIIAGTPSALVLRTLVELGDDAPGWLWSRWMTLQAHRGDLSEEPSEPDPAILRAVVAAYLHGVDEYRRPGLSPDQFWVTLHQCDWIVRQLRVYDGGELRRLVEQRASSDLISRADQIGSWLDAPMRGLQLIGDPVGPTLEFTDLASNEKVELLDLGLACDHEVGTSFIGRVVPISVDPGLMFEWMPLRVDQPTAVEVAALHGTPDQWVDSLAKAHVERRLPGMYSWYDKMTPIGDISYKAFLGLLREHQIEGLPRPRDMAGMEEIAVTACANALRAIKSYDEDAIGIGPVVATALLWPGAFERAKAQLAKPQFSEAWSMLAAEVPDPARGRMLELAAAGTRRPAA